MQRAPLELQGRMAAKRVCKSGKMEREEETGGALRRESKESVHLCMGVCAHTSVRVGAHTCRDPTEHNALLD